MSETTFSWESLEQFIGRQTLLRQAEEWLTDDELHLVFYTGGYGVGKTRLLKQISGLAETTLSMFAAPADYIDLYHAYHHSDEGLARALVDNFSGYKEYFFAFDLASQALGNARAAGDNRKAAEYLRAMLRACEDGMKRLSNDHGVLVLLDTAEQWVYPSADSGQSAAPAWVWLKSWMTELPKGVVVLAGRPVCEQLASEVNVQPVRLDYFNPQETADYIGAVTRNYQASRQSAEFVLSEDDIPRLHKLSEGRPILLSLYLQLAFQNREIRSKSLGTRADEFEEFLVNELMGSEIGDALRAAGRAPKGVDLALFAGIRGFRDESGSISNKNLEYASREFEQLKKMSFAKTFRGSDRLFLHDQMYDMLNRHIYTHQDDISEAQEAREAASQIFDYYKQIIEQKNQELQSLYECLARGIEFEEVASEEKESILLAIRAIESPRQNYIAEFISYRWRHEIVAGEDPIEAGLRRYYRFAHESASSGRYNLVVALRIELLNFLKDLEQGNHWRPFIQGLLLVQKVWEKLALGEGYGADISQLLQNLETIPGLPAHHKRILAGFLTVWQGTALIFARDLDYERARQLLSDAIADLQAVNSQEVSWFKEVADSLAHRQLAYLYSVQGQFDLAIRHFVDALKNSRAIDFYHEEATLRNDLGFVQMMVGKFQAARENIEEGLKLRYRVGIGTYIALSNSTLAHYHIANNVYDEARKRARYAIKISQAIGYERGEAFGSLALAEATRRYAFSSLGSASKDALLDKAENFVNDAVKSFEKLGEEVRIIESRLERGCVFRDKMRIVSGEEKDAYYQKSLEEFEWTAEQAGQLNIIYRRADALCNIIWLNFFAGKYDQAEQAAAIFSQMPELASYWLRDGKPVDETRARLNPILWSQIGKYHTAKGMLVFESWRKTGNKNTLSARGLDLRECASNFLLALHYSILFAADHRGLREGRRTVYSALTLLNREELKNFCYHARELANAHKLASPTVLEELMKEQALWFGPD